MKNLFIVVLTVLLAGLSETAGAQSDSSETKRGPYTLVVSVGGGLSYYSTRLGVPSSLEQPTVSRFGIPATLRVMWHPDHRLRLGLETGLVPMYSYQGNAPASRARVRVSAIPILLVFSMPLAWLSGTERSLARRLAVSGGTGAYLIRSHLEYAGVVNSSRPSVGWMLGGSYTQPIGRKFRVATELKWFNASATEDAAFVLQLQLVWRAFSW
ncbi:hypothetical protein [Spirosoma utsteinense]|uniref:Outer membrane protein beta-barrel domain-containing protein n=1 Tax=Spirosoma utsteinense TaxID=2585773 RepID=A0ABR6W0X0_9BACT|nr:hypothetical protein [Spirosoma utsteinense]MBC3783774.1 hypothetical protein [Spirosoma utsteinense]MBC3790082.1 hypothetical protein [Spirosoma utsteinense]